MPNQPSRRALLHLVAGGLVARSVTPARAQKSPKTAVAYRPEPNDGERCAGCAYFLPDQRACQLVAGDIAPDAWFSLFTPGG